MSNLVAFSNLDKVYFPEDGYTKRDLITYYVEIAPFILPYLKDRPLSMNRHPDGIHGKSFFQKDTAQLKPPPWVQRAPLLSESKGRYKLYLLCQDAPTLTYVANLGCIEINAWNSRFQTPEHVDYAIVDLDPVDTPFRHVVEAAQMVRKLLEAAGAECFIKTSGKRGLHIYIPLGARYTHDQAKQFCEIVATFVFRRLPKTTSIARLPSKRQGLVYLDYLQNGKSQTMAVPYSVRPVPGAQVSTPLAWREVTAKLDPTRFTIRTVPKRAQKVGDLWTGLLKRSVDLGKCLEKLVSLEKTKGR